MPDYTEKNTKITFNNLLKDYKIYAPVKQPGAGRLSSTDLITYDYVSSLAEIVFDEKTYFSPKAVLFPTRETMYVSRETMYVSKNGSLTDSLEKTEQEIPITILFLRSCDIHALKVLDTMFLKNGNFEDPYYKKRRENIRIFLLECPEAFETCFCVSMNTNQTQDYSVFLKKEKNGYSVKVQDQEFAKYFPDNVTEEVEPRFCQKDSPSEKTKVTIPKNIDTEIFKHPLWDEYSARCIACGRCNTSCPTCTCFSVQSVPDKDEPGVMNRKRIWSSCQIEDFSRLAGDHKFRKSVGDRMRYKVLHKVHDFEKRNGFSMCVGCGRCDDVCPEYISMQKSIHKINEVTAQEMK
ncbi:MAG: anaerobic sulfite reductase subunit AsrA [Leptospirales bacterium]